jgi:hypothetical protein
MEHIPGINNKTMPGKIVSANGTSQHLGHHWAFLFQIWGGEHEPVTIPALHVLRTTEDQHSTGCM